MFSIYMILYELVYLELKWNTTNLETSTTNVGFSPNAPGFMKE